MSEDDNKMEIEVEEEKTRIGEELAQKLACEDTVIRDKAWEDTKKELLNAQNDENTIRKLWIGLYFWYWHSDGKKYQEEVRKSITDVFFTSDIEHKMIFRYVCIGFETLREYWNNIDYVRIDKYEKLVFAMLQKYLLYMANAHWPLEYINEWNEYMLSELIPLKMHPISAPFSTRIADYYYDYMNDVIYIDEAEVPNHEAKVALCYPLTHYLNKGNDPQIHMAFEKEKDRLQTETYKYLDVGDIVKNCIVHKVKEFNQMPNLPVGMEKVKVLREMKKKKNEKKRKDKARKARRVARMKKEEREKAASIKAKVLKKQSKKEKEEKKPKKN